MIYFTGDMHGDKERIKDPVLRRLTAQDTLIVCGDFGFVWDASRKEEKFLHKLEKKPFTICFVDGTHENFSLLNDSPVVDFHGGRAHKIADNIYHLMRGEIFEIEGKRIFALGGGETPELRFQEDDELDELDRPEIPTKEEMLMGVGNMERVHYQVDYIVTHEPPASIRDFMLLSQNTSSRSALGAYLDELAAQAEFDRWYFGSLHMDKFISHSFVCVFQKIIKG
ncbi:MAG: metallophosphoesterase [Clostridia bacterium]|nr:metallophosphoesterase [Clostridia bacterium]MBR0509182.1 metallophosphoesterase [Clostridia bacterium]MBR0536593.1 metallophosphoesterase [Clostridia bacterium]